ncbi:MAG: polysaccharide deacetylase family protein [Flavobacteriales bacterium]
MWNIPGGGKKDLYLTFDDGPIPEVTPWVLDTLAEYDAKATFFCIGSNCVAHPEILDRIHREGHSVGNHTYDHLPGRKTPLRTYLRNVIRCQEFTGTRLFRPPYMSLTLAQGRALRSRFDVVLWDVLSGDFDPDIDGPQCLENVLSAARPGSIVLFHDSLGAEARVRYALPRVLVHFAEQGYRFRALNEERIR